MENKNRQLELNKELLEKKEAIFKELTENPSARQLKKFFYKPKVLVVRLLLFF